MTKPASFPRLHTQAASHAGPPQLDAYPRLADVCMAFERATGWPLYFEAGTTANNHADVLWSACLGGPNHLLGHLHIELDTAHKPSQPPIELESATHLAAEIVRLLNEQVETEHVVWLREAELAAGVPIVARADEPQRVAERLEAVLQTGAEAVGCQAAALYLLDAHTTQLKMRSAWGLARRKLCGPARQLQGSVADLEALTGHAVVLEKPDASHFWHAPEEFPSSVCVPVSSPTVPLGTLWMFATEQRAFSDRDLSLIELVSGRLATELERQMLLVESRHAVQLKRQLAAAQQLQRDQSTGIAPWVQGWEVGGWAHAATDLSGAFVQWQSLPEGKLLLAVGDVVQGGLAGSLVAQALRASLRAHGSYGLPPHLLLERINRDLWCHSSGDHLAALWCAIIEPQSGLVRCAAAGHPAFVKLSRHGYESLGDTHLQLGLEPEARFTEQVVTLLPNEGLAALSDQWRGTLSEPIAAWTFSEMLEKLAARLELPAADLAEMVRCRWESSVDAQASDAALLVIKRIG